MQIRLCLVVVGALLGLFIGEISFRFVIPSRDLVALERWRDQCWRVDASGYREQPRASGLVNVLVLGDSFASGVGICDPRDAFPWQLAQHLERAAPGGFRVTVTAKPGLDTRDELEILRRQVPPNVIVLSYFGNDIDASARDAGLPTLPMVTMYASLSAFPRAVVTTSRIANYIYWSLIRVDYSPILDHYSLVWARPDIVSAHLRELEGFFLPGVPVIVIVFPYLLNPSAFNYVDTVASHMRSKGATVVNVEELIADLPTSARVVSPNDPHASIEVHHRISAALAQALLSLK